MCIPGAHPWATGRLAGYVDPNVDDGEVTFSGGRGLKPRGQPSKHSAPQPEEDIGHLVSTLATGL